MRKEIVIRIKIVDETKNQFKTKKLGTIQNYLNLLQQYKIELIQPVSTIHVKAN